MPSLARAEISWGTIEQYNATTSHISLAALTSTKFVVAYRDGSILAQLGTPDMRTPIAHALAWPDRIAAGVEPLDLALMNDLSFRAPDLDRFPCLGLAFAAMRRGDSAPATLNAANEVAVESFLDGRIGFDRIHRLVAEVMDRVSVEPLASLENVLEQDRLARQLAKEQVLALQ